MAKEIDFPPVWLAGFAVAGGFVGRNLPVVTPVNDVLGGALVCLGVAIMAVAAVQMLIARTTLWPRRDPDAFVHGGIFRLSRNPIYLADAILLAGLYISWDALVALPLMAVFMEVIRRRFIKDEELRLSERFGEEFDIYRGRVRRWI
ncbi:MAG: isoprenylcysteine carboxylmethyltransferase family protein [Rhodobacteraceae bacterium]|nr:isoprenylcysteine carboxylmethyltransferase family protein [Paracoccaceae bacterium]